MRTKTYSPLPAWPPAVLAGLILLGGYVVGPLAGLLLHRAATRIDDNLAEFTTEGDT